MWVVLDAEFYLALDGGRDDCLTLAQSVCDGSAMILLPTAYQEIADLCLQTDDEELRIRALDALKFITANCVMSWPPIPVGKDAAVVADLIAANAFSPDQKNQALIIAEAACVNASTLLTLDSVIVGCNKLQVDEILLKHGCTTFEIKTA